MEETTVRSRQKEKTKSEPETEKMLLKNRKQSTDNYDFGEIQKLPTNIRDIMDKNFLRLFLWELYFGEIYFSQIKKILRCFFVK